MEQEKVHVRLLIVVGVAFLWMTAVFGRLTYLQLIRHSEYMSRAMRQQKRTIEIDPDFARSSVFRFVADRTEEQVAALLRQIDSGESPMVLPRR